MRQALILHPDSRCAAVARIAVDAVRRRPGGLALRYAVTGKMGDLRLPPAAAPLRADQLWRHTCFEAFVRPPSGSAYYEFNFTPSRQWAAYRFADYRRNMSAAGRMTVPAIAVHATAEDFMLEAALELDELPGLAPDAPWRLGLAAVIEEADGRISLWALAHPPGRADFHHPDGFVHTLEAVERP
jgi:hypothetical protein